MPSTDLPGWRLTFSDDFDTTVAAGDFPDSVSHKWDAYPSPWRDTSKTGVYSPEIVSFHDSIMDIHLHSTGGEFKVAAPVPLIPGGDGKHQLYGRYAVRFRADPVPGYKTAWLLWPKSNIWPRDGEIDFPEGNLNGTISAYMHRQGASAGSDQAGFHTDARFSSWHTAVIEWRPSGCEFFLDGHSIGKSIERVPETAMRWVIQTETAIDGGTPPLDAEGHVYLDWIAIWAYAG